MLRKLRTVLAIIFLAGITLLFVGIGQDWWGWMAKIQLLPAVYRLIGGFTLGNIAVVAAILLLTLIFGRIYCSFICPLGVFQDVVIWLRRKLSGAVNKCRVRKFQRLKASGAKDLPKLKLAGKKFEFSKERRVLRSFFFVVLVSTAIAAGQLLISLVAPYSAYGRMVQAVVGLTKGQTVATLLIVAAATFVIVGACAWLWGRAWCNTVCPVGMLLGYTSKLSLFKISIDESKCKACGKCGKACKASCIDMVNHTIDYSRCVSCFDCIGNCSEGAISYGPKRAAKAPEAEAKGVDRRAFISTAVVALGAAATARAQEMPDIKVDGGLAPLEPKQMPERSERIVPPGAGSVDSFYDHCTSCQLCVSACPNGVLRPSKDLDHFMMPMVSYDKGFCRPECTACSDVCPSGAIRPIVLEAKTAIKIGTARVNPELCLAAQDVEGCGNCSRHCPTGAIRMVVDDATSTRRPVVDEEQCIGCGACEYLCPVRPISAITVDGLSTHQMK